MMTSLYECQDSVSGKWVDCSVAGCGRVRRINQNMDMVLRLEQYKLKLEAGKELESMERADLEAIAQHVSDVINSFMDALQEALLPAFQIIAKVAQELWDSLPEQLQEQIKADSRDVVPSATLNDLVEERSAQAWPEVFGSSAQAGLSSFRAQQGRIIR